MGSQQPYEIQEVQIQSPSPGKEETQHQDRAGTDWLGSSSGEKNLGIVMSSELNMTQLHAWQQGMPTASWAVPKIDMPTAQYSLDHI